jgi:hypothetical protein
MPAGQYDISAEQGSTYGLNMNYKDDADNPITLAGYNARMQIRRSHTASTMLLSGDADSNDATLNITMTVEDAGAALPTGNVKVDISAATLSGIAPGNHVYDIELVSGDSVTRLLEGRFIITPEVTR